MRFGRWMLVPALALLLAACGGDEEETATGGAPKAYCDAIVEIETVQDPDIDFESLTPEQQAEAAKTFATTTLRPIADRVVANAPDEIRADIVVLNNALKEIETTGNFEVFEKPEVVAAEEKTHAFDVANCGWQTVNVRAVEYAFGGIPQELKAGVTSFEFANAGKEEHELAIFRLNDDVTEPFADILKLPEEEAQTKGVPAGHASASPSDDGYGIAKLTPGRYGVACFVPVGGKEDGPPHFTKGMFAEFKVV